MITNEDIFKGGAALGIAGGLFQSIKSGPATLIAYLRAQLYLTCVVESEEPLFPWVLVWLSRQPKVTQSGSLRVVTTNGREDDDDGMPHATTSRGARVPALVQGDGDIGVRYAGARLWCTVGSHTTDRGDITRTLTIRCRKRHRSALETVFAHAAAIEKEPDALYTRVLTASSHGGWYTLARRRQRAPDSVILPDGMLTDVINAAKAFFADEPRYANLGIPHRWGLLLGGPPGNGKSSLSLMLAGALASPLYVLPLGAPDMSDAKLTGLLGTVPHGCVIAIEDIDAVFQKRDAKGKSSLTFSGLLNAIDGPMASEGRILIMTTNHPERLDPALVRPGRADMKLLLPNATEDQARRMWQRFKKPPAGEAAFVRWAGDGSRSMADLQGVLLGGSVPAPIPPITPPPLSFPCLNGASP